MIPCPCGQTAALVTGDVIYPHRPDLNSKNFYLCECGRYVGCHPGSTDPLGTPADKPTRQARGAAHYVFDRLWKKEGMSRNRAYAWLANEMGIDVDDCHIGQFDEAQCKLVVELCDWRAARELRGGLET